MEAPAGLAKVLFTRRHMLKSDAMHRRPIIAANWKMHKTIKEAEEFLQRFSERVKEIKHTEIVIAPPFTTLSPLKNMLKGTTLKLAAQNMHFEKKGAYTGEVSPVMLNELGCEYVIIGHSERREHFKEDDELINRKLKAAFEYVLVPILCIGESFAQRRAGETEAVLARQLRADLRSIKREYIEKIVIAYEPIWAIGTGETASPEDAQAGAKFIRKVIKELYDKATAQSVRIQYGGSIKPENISEIIKQPDIDGALVGGASLDADAFAEIIKQTEMAKS